MTYLDEFRWEAIERKAHSYMRGVKASIQTGDWGINNIVDFKPVC